MDRVIAVSRSLKESILSHFNISSVVIPNIVDTQVFLRGEVNEKKDGPFFAFISVGRLIPLKRMDLLIRSFKQAFSDDPSVKLYIYGDGPERSRLGQLIRSSSLENQVFLMGFRSREDIAKKMAECDAFVLASDSETFGVVFIEAMAAGLPVIATYCGGPEDFVDDRYGILVKSGDESALTQAFREMRASHDRFNQIAISEEISARFNAEEIAAQIVDVYNAVTKNCL
jgi:glycosyltransferase involved in cell wall biosynthesis